MPSRPSARTRGGPSIDKLTVPAADERGLIEVDFGFDAGRRRVTSLDVALATPLGVVRQRLPAALAGIEGARGSGRLGIDSSVLPAGKCELTLALVGADGRHGPPASTTFEVAGGDGDGDGPALRGVRALSRRITRPSNDDAVVARLAIEGKVDDEEHVAVWVSVRTPSEVETTTVAGLLSEAGDEPFVVMLAAFRARDELGKYAARVALVDASGNVSELSEAVVELVPKGGDVGPSIDSFSPQAARAGDEVVVKGRGLEPDGLEVEVAGVLAPVVSAEGQEMRIRMPDVDGPGRIAVVTPAGTGLSAGELSPRIHVRVVPARADVPEGVPISLTAVVTGSTDGRVEWRAKAQGGKAGTISSEGVYTPPLGRRKGVVTITAVSSADGSALGRARLRVTGHPSARGPLPLGPLGGTVRSDDDRAVLELPTGALRKLTTIGLESVSVSEDDAPPGQVVVAAARITGGGPLSVPGELTLPLGFPLELGAEVHVQVRDDPGVPWIDLPGFGSVIPGNEALNLRLERLHVHIRVLLDENPPPPTLLPSIDSMTPSSLHEGETAAVLVTGKNFVPGHTSITVSTSTGAVEQRVTVGQIHVTADGTKLGVTFKAGVMTDLAEGDRRYLRLRIRTPAGSALGTLTILGHDELHLGASAFTVQQSGAYSRIQVGVGGTLRLSRAQPPVRLTAYETIVVGGGPGQGRGVVEVLTGAGAAGTRGDVSGARGAGGAGGATSLMGAGSGRGGAGGSGGTGAGTSGTSGGAGSASGAAGIGSPGQPPGAGGVGGFGSFILAGSGGDGANGTAAPMPSLASALFAPPLVLGAGGGGGGGGGGENFISGATGGGGGGGGAGGGALELAAGEEIRIRGRVAANGGDGGDGAFPFPVGTPPSAPLAHAGCGGAGGGGGGGAIFLRGLRLLVGEVLAVGGRSGRPARFAGGVITTPGTLTELARLLANPQSGMIQIEGSVPTAATVAPGAFLPADLDYRAELVTGNPQITVSGVGGRGAVRVRNTAGQQLIPATGDPFTVQVPLAPGFNDLDGVVADNYGPGGPPPVILTESHPVRVRRVLYLQGAGTTFGFACTISPATATVATERTLTLTAAVTGTTLTAVTWSVDGGDVNGVVDQQGNYRAPCAAPPGPVNVRATSVFDSTKSGTATLTVIPGIAVAARAAVGTPADPAAPSANVGERITITIPAAVQALTGQGFAAGQNTEFETVERDATGVCRQSVSGVAGTVAVGMALLQVAVPSCAAPDQRVKVSGHGCARLQVVPQITALDRSSSLGQAMAINGSGFACGATEVLFGATVVSAAQVLSVTCNVIVLGTRPAPGEQVTVRTAGGTSNPVT